MSELKAHRIDNIISAYKIGKAFCMKTEEEVYIKSEADKVIAELKSDIADLRDDKKLTDAILDKRNAEIAQLQAMLEERNKQVGEMKDRIAPKQANKTLQERLNEVCEKHGVSTLQDLDWAFCESEKRHTKDNIEAAKEINHQKYKRCLDMAYKCVVLCQKSKDLYRWAEDENLEHHYNHKIEFFARWNNRWLELAKKFKEAK